MENTIKCKAAGKCGACEAKLSYEEQLIKKQQYISNLFSSICKVDEIIGAKNPFYYRNKVHSVPKLLKNGQLVMGKYEENSHRVVPTDRCMIENKTASDIISDIAVLMKSFRLQPYDEDRHNGLIRHIMVRTAHKTGEIMVVIVTASPVFPSKKNFVAKLISMHPEITTVVLNINDRNTSMVLGKKDIVMYGTGYITDILCGKKFRLSPQSFYQINFEQTEILYSKALEMLSPKKSDKILDAYCGIGTIGIIASQFGCNITGVELNSDAVKDARENAKINGLKNIEFITGDAVQALYKNNNYDAVIMDPPRSGSDEKFLKALIDAKIKKILYISCGPETLKRDVNFLIKHGYNISVPLQPVDLFPMTPHVENIVLLSRKDK